MKKLPKSARTFGAAPGGRASVAVVIHCPRFRPSGILKDVRTRETEFADFPGFRDCNFGKPGNFGKPFPSSKKRVRTCPNNSFVFRRQKVEAQPC